MSRMDGKKTHTHTHTHTIRLHGRRGKLTAGKKTHTHTHTHTHKERVGPVTVAADPDNLESNKEAEGGAQGTQGSRTNCTRSSRESESPLSRLISQVFVISTIDPPLGGPMRVA